MGIEKLLKWKLWNKKYTKKVSVNISGKRIYFWTKNDWIVCSIESVETLMYDKVAHFLDIFFDLNTIPFYAMGIIYSRLKLYLEILWVIINISYDSPVIVLEIYYIIYQSILFCMYLIENVWYCKWTVYYVCLHILLISTFITKHRMYYHPFWWPMGSRTNKNDERAFSFYFYNKINNEIHLLGNWDIFVSGFISRVCQTYFIHLLEKGKIKSYIEIHIHNLQKQGDGSKDADIQQDYYITINQILQVCRNDWMNFTMSLEKCKNILEDS